MKRKKYIQKAKTTILNRVRFHCPIVYDDKTYFGVLQRFGIDPTKPIFKFEKTLRAPLLKAFLLAKKEENFTLILPSSLKNRQKRKFVKVDDVFFLDEKCHKNLLEMINKFNINYASSSNYNLVFKDRFFKVNGQILNPHFEDFSLRSVQVLDEIFLDYTEFVLNGKNFFLTLQNDGDVEKRVELELNIPLCKGYYYFKKMGRSILIENLISKEKSYLNFVCANAKFSFSDVDGLENSVFCCVNTMASVTLRPKEQTFVFFNLGESKFSLKTLAQAQRFKRISQLKVCEIFDVQVKTRQPKFDFLFNVTLPRKIWLNWLNGQVDDQLEQRYIAYRRLFLKGSLFQKTAQRGRNLGFDRNSERGFDGISERSFDGQNSDFRGRNVDSRGRNLDFGGRNVEKVKNFNGQNTAKSFQGLNFEKPIDNSKAENFDDGRISLVFVKELGLKEVGIFNGQYYKKIFVVSGDERFFKVGKTLFYNYSGITKTSLTSTEPLAVCFGE